MPIAGGAPDAGVADAGSGRAGGRSGRDPVALPEALLVAVVFAAASIFFGIFPSPLFHLAAHAGHAIGGIF
jgi:hypothetical protein